MSDSPTRRIVDVPGLIDYLGGSYSERHIRNLVASRRIPHGKMGHRVIFDLDDIDGWLEANKREVVEP